MGSNIKTLLVLLAFIAIAGGLYTAYNTYGVFNAQAQLLEDQQRVAELDREVLILLEQVRQINFNNQIFSRSDYQSLNDTRVSLPTPIISRPNPFAGL